MMNSEEDIDDVHTYSAVDMSKKKTASQPISVPQAEGCDPMMEMYSMVDFEKKHEARKLAIYEDYSIPDSSAEKAVSSPSKKKPETPQPFASIYRGKSRVHEGAQKVTASYSCKSRLMLKLALLIFSGTMFMIVLVTFILAVSAVAEDSHLHNRIALLSEEMALLSEEMAHQQMNITISNDLNKEAFEALKMIMSLNSSFLFLEKQTELILENYNNTVCEDHLELLNASLSSLENRTQILEYCSTKVQQLIDSLQNETDYQNDEAQQKIESLNHSLLSLENRIEQLEGIFVSGGQLIIISSCTALPPSSPSGYYWVRTSNGSAVRVYCNMTRSCGNITGGWMRVAKLDMTNSSYECPSGLMERNDSNIRTCVRLTSSAGCSPDIVYSVNSINYTRVCGRIIGYQIGNTNAFGEPTSTKHTNINTNYVDGVSLTHGRNPRKHIWTFAAARDSSANDRCPCINSSAHQPPSFVGTDYFCDTGSNITAIPLGRFFGDDPLWDGDGCTQPNTCCRFNTPPWFYRELPQSTTDDIEMRVCRNEVARYEDIAIEMVEIYVQ